MFDLPAVTTGQNAAVFTLDLADGTTLALRAFTSRPSRGPEVYTALAGMQLPDCMVSVGWFDSELAVNGERWPIVTMPWVEGLTLERWLDAHHGDAEQVLSIRQRLHSAVEALYRYGIAHGDLQHGNIIVSASGDITLIDYDGLMLFDPSTGRALTPLPSEAGHPNYQHPQRIQQGGIDRHADTFAALLIDLSLAAIANDPSVYRADGNSLALTAEDLDEPRGPGFDRLVNALGADERKDAELLRDWCTRTHHLALTPAEFHDLDQLPALSNRTTGPSPRQAPVTILETNTTQPSKPQPQPQKSKGAAGGWLAAAAALAFLIFIGVTSADQGPTGSTSSASSQSDTSGSGSSTTNRSSAAALEWEVGACVRAAGDVFELVSCSRGFDAVIVRQTTPQRCPEYYWPEEGMTTAYWLGEPGDSRVDCLAPSRNAEAMLYRVGACLRELPDGSLMPVPCSTSYDFFVTSSADHHSQCPDYYLENGARYLCLTW